MILNWRKIGVIAISVLLVCQSMMLIWASSLPAASEIPSEWSFMLLFLYETAGILLGTMFFTRIFVRADIKRIIEEEYTYDED